MFVSALNEGYWWDLSGFSPASTPRDLLADVRKQFGSVVTATSHFELDGCRIQDHDRLLTLLRENDAVR